MKIPLTVPQWDKQKLVLERAADHEDVDLGFATFFLNRRTARAFSVAAGIKVGHGKSTRATTRRIYAKGPDLYYDSYEQKDHASVASFVLENVTRQRWIVSCDNVPPRPAVLRVAAHCL
jgi:hypothetical protein